ncbi:MAG: hypothetical protein IJE00_08655 [Clostridia bacterium]|nr:hypothetical protein [Clostridia bacterium]
MTKGPAFLLSLLLTLTVLLSGWMWISPQTPPSPVREAGITWQREDDFSLRLIWEGHEAVVRFEPARKRVTVAKNGDADRQAVLTEAGLLRLLTALGNDLPLTLGESLTVAEEEVYLQLPAGAHILAAEQVAVILRKQPERWLTVVAAMINAYATADRDPLEQLTLLINCCRQTDLSAKDGVVAHDRLVYLWGANRGGLAIRQ